MNRKKQKNFHIPSPKATVFEFEVNRKDDQRCIINVIRDEAFFYRLENGGERKVLIGDFKNLMEYLFKTGGCFVLQKKSKKIKTSRVFIPASDASFLLKEGYKLYHLQSSSIMSYDKDYTNIIVVDHEVRRIGSLPGGLYCVAWLEERNPMTMDQVEAERQRAMEAEAKLREEAERQAREAARKAARQEELERKNEEKNSTAIPKPEPVENDDSLLDSLLKIAGGIGIFLTGIGLGMFLDKKLN